MNKLKIIFLIIFLLLNFSFFPDANSKKILKFSRSASIETILIDKFFHKLSELDSNEAKLIISKIDIDPSRFIIEDLISLLKKLSDNGAETYSLYLEISKKMNALLNDFETIEKNKASELSKNFTQIINLLMNLDEEILRMFEFKISDHDLNLIVNMLEQTGFSIAAKYIKIRMHYLRKKESFITRSCKSIKNRTNGQ